ncbi:hypothetical protein [Liquorilactobacillus mali]|uniref:hypothetical protein n=1 Tax=Liquorilactobacillus mali TaxID=1618 RepID=UPI0039EC1508
MLSINQSTSLNNRATQRATKNFLMSYRHWQFQLNQAIYVSGNQGPSNSSGTITLGTVPKIGKALWGKVPNNLTLYNTNWPNGYIEIEGLQLTGDYIYFGLSYHDESSLETTENRIYRVDKSYWD